MHAWSDAPGHLITQLEMATWHHLIHPPIAWAHLVRLVVAVHAQLSIRQQQPLESPWSYKPSGSCLPKAWFSIIQAVFSCQPLARTFLLALPVQILPPAALQAAAPTTDWYSQRLGWLPRALPWPWHVAEVKQNYLDVKTKQKKV